MQLRVKGPDKQRQIVSTKGADLSGRQICALAHALNLCFEFTLRLNGKLLDYFRLASLGYPPLI